MVEEESLDGRRTDRRSCLKKLALGALGVGALLSLKDLPKAHAAAYPFMGDAPNGGPANGTTWITSSGAPAGTFNATAPIGTPGLVGQTEGVVAPPLPAGVVGAAATNLGVYGISGTGVGVKGWVNGDGGIGVQGEAGNSNAIPVVAKGAPIQNANLQEWQDGGGAGVLTVVDKNGKIGVGTSTPGSPIDVAMNIAASERRLIVNTAFGGDNTSTVGFVARRARGSKAAPTATQQGDTLNWLGGVGYGASAWPTASSAGIGFYAAENWSDTAQGSSITFGTTATGEVTRAERMRISPSGNVGIGTTNPFDRLTIARNGNTFVACTAYGDETANPGFTGFHARGSSTSPSATLANDTLLWLGGRGYGPSGWADLSRAGIGFQAAEDYTDLSQGSRIIFQTTPIGSTSRTERMRITAGGNVGVGTTTPQASVHGKSISASTKSIIAQGTASQTANLQEWQDDTSTALSVIDKSGWLGIGTSTPAALIHVLKNAPNPVVVEGDGSVGVSVMFDNYYATGGAYAGGGFLGRMARGSKTSPANVAVGDRLGFNVFGGYAGGAFRHVAAIEALVDSGTVSASSLPSAIRFLTASDGTIARQERMRINKDGRVGIGTASPTDLLDVNSNMIRVRTAKTPASSSDTGNAGEICWDSNYVYVCVAANTWKRAALSTW